jgi:PAS domain S-box-containing protein
MTTGSLRRRHIKDNSFRYASAILRWIIEPSAIVEEKQHRRVRLLSAFLLLIAINTLIGAMVVKNAGNSSWPIMLATAAILTVGYGLSRTRYYSLATALAIIIPTIPIFAMIFFSTNRTQIPHELPWLALPLLVCSLLLSLRSTIIIAFSYILFIILLIPFVNVPAVNLIQSLGFILMIFFFVVAVTAARKQDQSEIENQLTERKQAEDALRESEEKYRNLFDLSPVGITVLDMKGMIVSCNEAVYQKSGYSKEDYIGKHFSKIASIRLQDIPKFIKIFTSLVRGKVPEPLEVVYHRKDGTKGWTEVRIALLASNGKKTGAMVLQTDITERKGVEEALQKSEEKFSKAFRSSPNTMVITTVKDGKFIEVNDSHTRSTGYTREETIGHTAVELGLWAKPGDRARMIQLLKEQGRVQNEEFDFRMKSGEIRTWLFSAEPINIGGEPCLISMTIDITELKRAEEELRFTDAAFKSIHESVIAINNEGIITYWSSFSEKMFGVSAAEAIGKYLIEVVHVVEQYPGYENKLAEKFEKKGYDREEILYTTKHGYIWVDMSIQEIQKDNERQGYVLTGIDITERKRAEEELKLRAQILDSATDSIFLHDFDKNFIYVNKTACRIHGYSREEFIKMKLSQVIAPERVSRLDSEFQEMLEKDQVIFESAHLRKDGSIMPAEVHGRTIDSGGKKLILTVIRDITERKRAEEKLKEALTNLEYANAQLTTTNKELEAFSYSVSHDLRSPLRTIDGFSQALLEDYMAKLDAQGQDYLRRLRGASQKMGELIDGLIKLSRLARSEMHEEKVDLSALAKDITTRLQETQPQRRAEFIIDRGLTTRGDPQLLRALLENLLGNAWKFTDKRQQARIEFGATQNGDKKAYFVRDNGAGFDMTYADKLFGAFQRLHKTTEFPGTGIGLATVQRIINRHGGSVWAEGAVGEGATFYFTLS